MTYKKLKYWFDKELAELLANKILQFDPKFQRKDFVSSIEVKVESLELKDRVEVIADELYYYLGEDYTSGISILTNILGHENKNETGMFTDFYWVMPIAKYVEKYGINDFDQSMSAIEEITKRNTGEYTIRPFIEKDAEKTIQQMIIWSGNKNKHVRRLSSEGVRPRLPWAKKLEIFIKDPAPLIPILNNLKDDASKYVQKSVANCLNDIFKDNFETGKQVIEDWNSEKISNERKWIIRHSLRNLIKADNEWAKRMVKQ